MTFSFCDLYWVYALSFFLKKRVGILFYGTLSIPLNPTKYAQLHTVKDNSFFIVPRRSLYAIWGTHFLFVYVLYVSL